MTIRSRRPEWLRVGTLGSGRAEEVRKLLRRLSLDTVCREAGCPNIGHCFERGAAAFLVLGDRCTRSCRYCGVKKADTPLPPPDPGEPRRIAEAACVLGLRHVVITSVTRDDLPDGGAGHFAEVVSAIRASLPGATVELLVPDFRGSAEALSAIAAARPDILNHNIETVRRLFPSVRPGASYRASLDLLASFAGMSPGTPLKSGMMLGMGETRAEVTASMADLRRSGVSLLTLGQYLAPSAHHWPVERYLEPSEFEELREEALDAGFSAVASGPLVRSSYHAGDMAGSPDHGSGVPRD